MASDNDTCSASTADADSFLYELLVLCEWSRGPELPIQQLAPSPADAAALAWRLCLSDDGRRLAVLQPDAVEVRLARDNFTSLVGRYQLNRPSTAESAGGDSRCAAWCPRTDMLVVTAGGPSQQLLVLDRSAELRLTVELQSESSSSLSISNASYSSSAVAQLIFIESFSAAAAAVASEAISWRTRLLVLLQDATLVGLDIGCSGADDCETWSYRQAFRCSLSGSGLLVADAVTCAVYAPSHRLLLVAGRSQLVGSQQLQGLASCEGIAAWRLLAGEPHVQLCSSLLEDQLLRCSSVPWLNFRWWQWLRRSSAPSRDQQWDPVVAMSVSPDSRRLASVHMSGALTVWQFPALRKLSHWPLASQPDIDAVNPHLLLRLSTQERHRQMQRLVEGGECLNGRLIGASWWSSRALALVRCSGAVTVSSCGLNGDDELLNLLGDCPEFFSERPLVVVAAEAGYLLALECERGVRPPRRRADTDSLSSDNDITPTPAAFDEDSEEDTVKLPADGFLRAGLERVRSVLHWLTDWERFEPSHRSRRQQLRPLHSLYRLSCLRKTTPEQLFVRRLELREYSEALALARRHDLDADQVYLHQWKNSEVSEDTIEMYLSRIGRRDLVLDECCSRLPSTLQATRRLLEYGLQLLDRASILGAVQSPLTQISTSLQQVPSHHRSLTDEQRQRLLVRRRLLMYLHRLNTFEKLLNCSAAAVSEFSGPVFGRFRDTPLQLFALDLARRADWRRLSCLLTQHGRELSPWRLILLANIPDTTSPDLYSPLLPGLNHEAADLENDNIRPRDNDYADWSDEWVGQLVGADQDFASSATSDVGEDSAFTGPDYAPKITGHPSAECLTAWYRGRALDMTTDSCLVENSVLLLDIGVRNGVPGLEELSHQLRAMSTLVYQAGCVNMQLGAFRALEPVRIVELMMADATCDNVVQLLKDRLVPYLTEQDSGATLFQHWMLSVAVKNIALIDIVVEHGLTDPDHLSFLSGRSELASLTIECVYVCERSDELVKLRKLTSRLQSSSVKCQRVLDHLVAAELLQTRGVPTTLMEIARLASAPDQARVLLDRVARSHLASGGNRWQWLIEDLYTIQSSAFPSMSVSDCQEVFVLSLLTSSSTVNIDLAGSLMFKDKGSTSTTTWFKSQLPFEVCSGLVLTAAREYFDAASSLTDPSMQLARRCLQLISFPSQEVRRELALLDSLECLLDFGVNLLPVQVRLTTDRYALLLRCIKARPDSYRRHQLLERLVKLLDVPEGWRLQLLIAEHALAADDPHAAALACHRLASENRPEAWRICRQLAWYSTCGTTADKQVDVEERLEVLSFALRHCPAEELESLLLLRQRLVVEQMSRRVAKEEDGSIAAPELKDNRPTDDEEVADNLSAPMMSGARRLVSSTASSVMRVTSKTANTLLRFPPLVGTSKTLLGTAANSPPTCSPCTATEIACSLVMPAFYCGLHSKCRESVLYGSYDAPPLCIPEFERALITVGQKKLDEASECSSSAYPELIAALLPVLAAEDWQLFICACFTIPVANIIKAFADIPPTEPVAWLQAYGCALKLLLLRSHHEESPAATADDLFVCRVPVVIQSAVSLSESDCHDAEERALLNLLTDLLKTAEQLSRTDQLLSLNDSVDAVRFHEDADYRRDTLLGLTMSDDEAALASAAQLADRFGVDRSSLGICHVVHLFSDSDMSPDVLHDRITHRRLVSEVLDSDRDGLREALVSRVAPILSGSDHARLIVYYELLTRVSTDEVVSQLTARVTFLKLLCGSSCDFWRLLSDSAVEITSQLSSLLTEANVDVIAALVPNLGVTGALTSSLILLLWIHKAVFDKPIIDCEEVEERFRHLHCMLRQLSPEDFRQCGHRLLFSDESLYLDLAVRQAIVLCLRAALDNRTESVDEWLPITQIVDGWEEHLDYMEWGAYTELLRSDDENVRFFARQFDKGGGDRELLRKLRTTMVFRGSTASSLRQMLEVFPMEEASPLGTVVLQALRQCLEKGGPLEKLGQCVGSCIRDPEAVLDEKTVAEEFERMCDAVPDIDDARRLVLTKQFLRGADCSGLRHLFPDIVYAETCALFPKHQITADSLASGPSREYLFTRLLNESDLPNYQSQHVKLLSLLLLWPEFEQSVYNDTDANPLCQLFEYALGYDRAIDTPVVPLIFEQHANSNRLPAPVHLHLVQRLKEDFQNATGLDTGDMDYDAAAGCSLAVRVALMSSDRGVRAAAVDAANAAEAVGCSWALSAECLDQLLGAELLPLLFGGELYEPAVGRLLQTAADVTPAVQQLRGAGLGLEASRLLMDSRSRQPLDTISAAKHAASKVFSRFMQ